MSLDQHLELVVQDVQRVADDVVCLTLAHADGTDLPPWTPGAHLSLGLPAGSRQYSLCGDPADLTRYRIAVLRVEEGRGGSEYVHDQLAVGTVVRVREPRNNFELVDAEAYVFIAGGIGITPILPMLRAAEASGKPWHLYYGGRTRPRMAFLDELAPWSDRVTLVPQDSHGFIDLEQVLGSAIGRVYCCGPEPLLAAVERISSTYPSAALHLERFAATVDDVDRVDEPFEVVCQTSGITVEVPADQSMLDAMLEAGIDVDSDCEEGICGTCELRVIAGTPDHRDDILTEEEKQELILPCVSRIFGTQIVVEA
jgi:ferredoxin-NADP reductase